jgi:hypothetical protein
MPATTRAASAGDDTGLRGVQEPRAAWRPLYDSGPGWSRRLYSVADGGACSRASDRIGGVAHCRHPSAGTDRAKPGAVRSMVEVRTPAGGAGVERMRTCARMHFRCGMNISYASGGGITRLSHGWRNRSQRRQRTPGAPDVPSSDGSCYGRLLRLSSPVSWTISAGSSACTTEHRTADERIAVRPNLSGIRTGHPRHQESAS